MIADLRPYPAYKESGVEWLGEVPEGWQLQRLRRTVESVVAGVWGEDPTGIDDVPCVRVADFDRHRRRVRVAQPTLRQIPVEDRGRRILSSGDLLLEKSGGGEQQPVGAVVLYDHDLEAVSSNFVARLRPAGGHLPSYLNYLHEVLYSRGLNIPWIKQTTGIQNLDVGGYLTQAVPVPQAEDQAAIVRFLDHVESRIQRLIAAKERLIELLEEEKQAIIHRAVTRGLDPDVPLKPSGVDWLGEIPRQWTAMRLQELTDRRRPIMYGIVLPGPDVDEGVHIVKGGNCEPGRLRPELLAKTTFEIEANYSRSRLRGGDIVIAIRGGVGSADVVPHSLTGANITQDAARVACRTGVSPHWLVQLLRSPTTQHQIRAVARGATIRGINIRDLRRIEVPVPPAEEQHSIAEFIDHRNTGVDRARSKARDEVRLLNELRTRLISDVVTGKLDVRGVAERLPADPDADDPPPRAAHPAQRATA